MDKIKAESGITLARLFFIWALSLGFFFLILYLSNFDFLKAPFINTILFLLSFAVGVLTYIAMMIEALVEIIRSKNKTAVLVLLFGLIAPFAVLSIFGWSPALMFKSDGENQAPSPTAIITQSPTPSPTISTKKTSTPNTDKQITCIGPDKKQFKTTKKACDELNAAWGNSNNDLIDCHLTNCGLTVVVSESECKTAVCCQLSTGKYVYAKSNSECSSIRGSGNTTNPITNSKYTYPTLAPLPTWKPYPTANSTYPTSTQNNTSTSTQDYTQICKQQLATDQSNANQLSGSARDAVLELAQQNYDRCMSSGTSQPLKVAPQVNTPTPTIIGWQ